jgi:hypothetical protein
VVKGYGWAGCVARVGYEKLDRKFSSKNEKELPLERCGEGDYTETCFRKG